MSNCPICSSGDVVALLEKDDVPILQNNLLSSVAGAKNCTTSSLRFVCCRSCGFIWNKTFDPALVKYDPSYDNAQHYSSGFNHHTADMIADIVADVDKSRPIEIAEIGCGQGDFLRDLVKAIGPSIVKRAVGFDPALAASGGGAIELHKAMFEGGLGRKFEIAPDVVVARHVVEHTPDPVHFLREIAEAIAVGKRARFFIETPNAEWIVRHRAYQDIYFEHFCKFSAAALALALRAAGFHVRRIWECFGGQYLRAEALLADRAPPGSNRSPEADFRSEETRFVERWRDKISTMQQPVYLWGAGGKGTMFAYAVDPERTRIAGIIDINPNKHGKFVPKSGHQVIPPETLAETKPDEIIVTNELYVDEIRSLLSAMGLNPKLNAI